MVLALLFVSSFAGACAQWFEPVTLPRAVALVAARLPAEARRDFERLAAPLLALPVGVTRGPSRLAYVPRLFDWRVRRRARVRWSIAPQTDDELVARIIDLVTEAAFTPVRRTSIYLRARRAFVDDNVELWRQKLTFQIAAGVKPAPGRAGDLLKRALRPLLPTQFAAMRGLRLNADHVRAYDAGGAAGLYAHLRRREGRELAVRYWATHVSNVIGAVSLAYAMTLVPPLYDAGRMVWDLHALNVDDAHVGVARTLRDALVATPERVLAGARHLYARLGPDERRALAELFAK